MFDANDAFTSHYGDLKRLARREVTRNGAQEFLGMDTIVHEAWLDMRARPGLRFEEAGRFLAYAARTMRGLVVDRVRAHHALKRGGGLDISSLDSEEAGELEQPAADGVAAALKDLAALDPALAEVVDLRFFGGFTLAEVARMRGTSERTAQRMWEKARGLLSTAMLTS